MKKPTNVFGRTYNREFVQTLMDLIFSFHDTGMCRGDVQLRITIQKNLYLGAIWLRFVPFSGDRTQKRRYTNTNWISLPATRAHRYLREALKWAEPSERQVLKSAVKATVPATKLNYPYKESIIEYE